MAVLMRNRDKRSRYEDDAGGRIDHDVHLMDFGLKYVVSQVRKADIGFSTVLSVAFDNFGVRNWSLRVALVSSSLTLGNGIFPCSKPLRILGVCVFPPPHSFTIQTAE